MELFLCSCIGYGLGCLNPSYLFSKLKDKDLREHGTGNLGATNAFLYLGKKVGIFIMIFDILKAVLAVKICKFLFPRFALTGIVAGFMSMIGHVFPFYLNFKGGKGLACFGGFVLATDWKVFLFLLALGIVLAIIFDYACAVPFSAATFYPFIHLYKIHSLKSFFVMVLCSLVVFYKHTDNIRRIKDGTEQKVRDYFSKKA